MGFGRAERKVTPSFQFLAGALMRVLAWVRLEPLQAKCAFDTWSKVTSGVDLFAWKASSAKVYNLTIIA